jgi:hypothetical protein
MPKYQKIEDYWRELAEEARRPKSNPPIDIIIQHLKEIYYDRNLKKLAYHHYFTNGFNFAGARQLAMVRFLHVCLIIKHPKLYGHNATGSYVTNVLNEWRNNRPDHMHFPHYFDSSGDLNSFVVKKLGDHISMEEKTHILSGEIKQTKGVRKRLKNLARTNQILAGAETKPEVQANYYQRAAKAEAAHSLLDGESQNQEAAQSKKKKQA